MSDYISWFTSINAVSVLIFLIMVISIYQGTVRGASGSARHLFFFILDGCLSVVSLLLVWKMTVPLSETVQQWLTARNITIPAVELPFYKQLYYTIITGIRDFTLLRYGIIFLVGYMIVKNVLYSLTYFLLVHWEKQGKSKRGEVKSTFSSILSSLSGGLFGIILGAGRVILVIAILFVGVTLFPSTGVTKYIQTSMVYQKGAKQIIEPLTGDFFTKQVPVFTQAAQNELGKILQRKYEVIDYAIPTDIEAAAKEITKGGTTDEEKARLLYDWVGTRVIYDWDKVRLYEDKEVWMEQTPQNTFDTRKGVCIDYSRLYAVMARAVGLEVKVITGLGYDGKGGYGAHAWNEIYLSHKDQWVPLDSTWAIGGNWFNPDNFYETHVKDA